MKFYFYWGLFLFDGVFLASGDYGKLNSSLDENLVVSIFPRLISGLLKGLLVFSEDP